MTTIELKPIDGRKSFYGKAIIYLKNDGSAVLKSYDTDVCSVDKYGNFSRHWRGYSATTMRHINSFLDYFGIDGGGKNWWINQPVTHFDFVSFFFGKIA